MTVRGGGKHYAHLFLAMANYVLLLTLKKYHVNAWRHKMDKKKNIGNIGVLDIRNATDKSIEAISSIKNAGVVLYSKETAHLLPMLNLGNLGSSIEVEGEDFKMITGKLFLEKSSLASFAKSNLIITGKIVLSNTLTVDDVKEMVGKLIITGKMVCPKNILAPLQEKIIKLTGKISTYPENTILFDKNIAINSTFLAGMAAKSRISVLGNITFDKNIINELVQDKIEYIYVDNKIMVHEQQVEILNGILDQECSGKLEIIPAGFDYINNDFKLDKNTLEAWGHAKSLYVAGNLEVNKDVDTHLFDKKISALILKQEIICKNNLRMIVSSKCKDINIEFVTYETDYMFNDGDFEMVPSYLKYASDKLVIINNGVLKISKEVDADVLFNQIDKIYNTGTIEAYGDQVGALQVKLVKNEGEIGNLSKNGDEDNYCSIRNVGYLAI